MEANHCHPRELEEAVALLEEQEGTVLVNDGSGIVLNISAGKITPTGIIDMRSIESINTITDNGQYMYIEGNITYRQMQDSPMCGRIGGLTRAADNVGSLVIRVAVTPAGNIATAAPSVNCAFMVLALNTELVLVSVKGERIVRQRDIYLGAYKMNIQNNEIIREMWFPSPGPDKGSEYARFSRRESQDVAKVITGMMVTMDKKGRYLPAAISLGALNATTVLAPSIRERIKGLGRDETIQLALKFFPREMGLRENYFKRYKEETTCNAIAEALDMTFTEAEKGGSCYACGSL